MAQTKKSELEMEMCLKAQYPNGYNPSCYCVICGVKTNGKIMAVINKAGVPKFLCPHCFNKTMTIPASEIRKMIRN